MIITRKLFEVIYAPIFFAGYKKELNIPKERDYYRYYLVYIYLHTVQTNLNGTIYAPLDKIFSYGFSQLRALEFFVFRKMEMPETQNPPAMWVESICL